MAATFSRIRMNKELRAQLRRAAPAFLIAAGNWLIRRRRLTAGSTENNAPGWEDYGLSAKGGNNALSS
jgi:hypothetical protein